MTPNLRVMFALTGVVDVATVAAAIDLEPTRTWRIGESVGGTLLRRKENGWVLELKSQASDFEELVQALLLLLEPHAAAIAQILSRGTEAEIACEALVHDEAPPIALGAVTLRRIAALGASLDVDIILV